MKSIEPVFKPQAGHVREIAGISGQQGGIARHDNRGDPQVLGAGPNSQCLAPIKCFRSDWVPRQSGPRGVQFDLADQSGVSRDQRILLGMTSDFRHFRPNWSASREIASSGIIPTVVLQSLGFGTRFSTSARSSTNCCSRSARRSSKVNGFMAANIARREAGSTF